MKRKFNPEDVNNFVFYGKISISYHGDMIAFTTVKPDRSNDRYDVRVRIVDLKGYPIYVSPGPYDVSFVWRREGSILLYQRIAEDKKTSEIRLVDIDKGLDFVVAKLENPATSLTWLDNETAALIIPTKLYKEEPGVHIIRSWPVWFDGTGFVYNVRSQIYLLDISSGSLKRVTQDEYNYTFIAADPYGRYLISSVAKDPSKPYKTSLAIIRRNGDIEEISLGRDIWIGPLAVSSSGRYVAFMGRDNEKGKGFASHEEIWLLDLDSLRLESLTRSLGLGSSRRVYYDLRGPGASEPAPVWDGDEHIYFPVSKGGRYSLYRYSMKTGFIEPILDGEYVVWDYDVRNNIIVYIKTSSTEPLEIWMLEPGKEPVKITRFNDLIKEYKMSEPKHFIFTASDEAEIEGWVIEPVDREEGRRYPAILWIHGGPKSKFGWSFMFEFQLYASNGYAVIYCNPRGSDGYSEDFADIRGHYGERDYQDIIECLDHALKRFDFIDPERIGVTGISYGGFMTNWIITQTDRFKAAVSQNGISTWEAEYLTTDIGVYFVPDQLKGDPWREWERLRAKSPLYYVDYVKTPLMIIHSIDDYRCWLDQAIAMFTALKTKGKETELILFEEGGHIFGWSGRPRLREARLNNMLRWFDKHLKTDMS